MKITTFLIALIFVFAGACSGNSASEDHGHPHDTESADDHGHSHDGADHAHDEDHEQEEFVIESDSSEVKESTHTHDDGSTHEDH